MVTTNLQLNASFYNVTSYDSQTMDSVQSFFCCYCIVIALATISFTMPIIIVTDL